MSLIVTVVPAAGVGAICRWVQKVSPLGLRNWSTSVWPGPTVRAVALSQSSPTPQTQLPERVVTSETEGAPDAAELEADGAVHRGVGADERRDRDRTLDSCPWRASP